ncbi:MAG: radical SAM protein [Elusimicrobia bacterium]|nr:radical SAM protein [Elusimicrobiota bacterium]
MFKNILRFLQVKKCRKAEKVPDSILFLLLWITNNCNLKCKMCDQWKTCTPHPSGELPTEEWYSVIDSAEKMHTMVISLTGGEIFLRPDVFRILEYIRKKGIACHICTNGTTLNESVISKLADSKPNSISISLDSYRADIHNELRGTNCFDTVINGIRLLKKIIPDIKTGINYLICRKNFRDMDRMITFAEKLGVDQIKFAPIHTNLQHRNKPLQTFEDLLFTKEDIPALEIEIKKLIHASSHSKLQTISATFAKGIPAMYDGQRKKFPCYAGYISCSINPLGMVSPCIDMTGTESVREKLLEDIWHSASFQQLRNKVNTCSQNCWDTTNTELNIRCSTQGLISEFGQILKDIRFYLK